MNKLKILILDDEKAIQKELQEYLHRNNFNVFQAMQPSKAWELLKQYHFDVLILDLRLPQMNGLEFLQKTKQKYPGLEVIMITGHGDMDSVIEAMRLGANEFLQKPFRLLELKNAIQRTQRYLDLQQELSSIKRSYHVLSEELKEEIGHALIVESKSMKKLLGDMNKVAASNNTTVLINGESGTGKELVARGIHSLSKRSEELFYPVNCSAMPDTLVESIVFGHVKGAFTGADKEQKGIFEIANKGTVFLDEIGDMPMAMQSKFLRVLEERKFSRVGSHQRREFDVRILAATNQDLQKLIEQGKFREDLFHRINSFQLEIPALRARPEDINPLLEFFTKYFSQKMKKDIKHIDSRVYRKMHQYDFPGNVRELKNLVERAVILTPGRVLKAEFFELGVAVSSDVQDFNLEIQEKRLIKAALEKTDFNKVQAAKLLNLSRQALDRRIKKYNLS